MQTIKDFEKELNDRLKSRLVGGEKLNALQLKTMTIMAFSKYNKLLVRDVKKVQTKFNRHVAFLRLFGIKIPYFAHIIPSIGEEGTEIIKLFFEYDKRIKGIASLDTKGKLTFDFKNFDYDWDYMEDFLKSRIGYLGDFFDSLDQFKEEFPGFEFEFGTVECGCNATQVVDDGFLRAEFDLNNVGATRPSISKSFINDGKSSDGEKSLERDDILFGLLKEKIALNVLPCTNEYSQNQYMRDFDLEQYLQLFDDKLLASMEVDEERLNPVFKRIVEKAREEIPGTGSTERKLRP